MIDANRGDAYEHYAFPILHEGDRVRLRAPAWGLTLRADTGTVIRASEDEGEYVIRLDAPALYDHGIGEPVELSEVVEASDNVDILDR